MEKIRIGNDISVTWGIVNSGEPYDLSGKDLKLYLSSPNRIRVEIQDFQVQGNVISFVFYGKDQKAAGIYSCTLVENEGQEGMMTVDSCNVFQLVDWSCRAVSDSSAAIDLQSDILVNVVHPIIPEIGENGHWWIDGKDTGKPAYMEAGMSAYDIAVAHGFEGTEEEWLRSLKGDPGVSVPAFDLLTTASKREKYTSGADKLTDFSPCLRFRGDYPANTSMIDIYRYQNRGNKKYKRVDTIPVGSCEKPDNWNGGGYSTLVLGASLMRIFWRVYDPTITDASDTFNGTAYSASGVATAWLTRGATGVKKYGHNSGLVSPRTRKAKYTASFGIRLRDSQTGSAGDMVFFRIILRMSVNTADNHRDWRFSMKLDTGQLL